MGREMALPSGAEEEIWLAKAMAAAGGAVGIPQLCRCVRVCVLVRVRTVVWVCQSPGTRSSQQNGGAVTSTSAVRESGERERAELRTELCVWFAHARPRAR